MEPADAPLRRDTMRLSVVEGVIYAAMVGLGGVAAEGLGADRFAPAPLTRQLARRLLLRVPGLATLLRRHSGSDEALDDLAGLVAETSRRFVASGLEQLEMNPLAWTGERWEILDALVV